MPYPGHDVCFLSKCVAYAVADYEKLFMSDACKYQNQLFFSASI